jgi:hypothetical protein
LGVESGLQYNSFLRADGGKKGTNFSFKSEKTGREIQCLSMGERAVAMLLEVDPWVVDYREQYPRASDDLLAAIVASPSDRVLRNKVFTLDFVVTYQNRQSAELHYGVLSVKASRAETKKKSVQRRFAREREDAMSRNWAWNCVVKEELDATAVLAAERLIRWGGAFAYRDCQDVARKLASIVGKVNSGQPLDDLLNDVSKRLGMSLDDAYQYFAMAVCFGLIAVDLKKGLDSRLPLCPLEARWSFASDN